MIRLKRWQWLALTAPIALVVGFLLTAAGFQIHAWGLNWIWAVVILLFAGWRWLLVRWTRSAVGDIQAVFAEVNDEIADAMPAIATPFNDVKALQDAEAALKRILDESTNDPPAWEDWATFWERCRAVVVAIAHIYHPEVKYPLLNIYVPQAYGLIRGTVDDMDRWMQQVAPVLNQVTVGQAYQGYEMYQKLEPSARKLWQIWNWAQWILNPAAAVAKAASQSTSDRAAAKPLSAGNRPLQRHPSWGFSAPRRHHPLHPCTANGQNPDPPSHSRKSRASGNGRAKTRQYLARGAHWSRQEQPDQHAI